MTEVTTMRRFLRSWFGRKIAPLVLMYGVISFNYWLYSMHTSSPTDSQDTNLAGTVAVFCVAILLYLQIRTRRFPIQLLGALAFICGDVVFYGGVWGIRVGQLELSQEQLFDLLRSCVTTAMILYTLGIIWFELSRKRKHEPGSPALDPSPIVDDAVLSVVTDRRDENRQGVNMGRRSTDRA